MIARLVLANLLMGVASIGCQRTLVRIGSKTIIYYLLTTGVAIVIGLAVAFVITPGEGLDLNVANTEEVDINESEGTVQTLLEIVPENPFSALAEAEILQIIFFAVF